MIEKIVSGNTIFGRVWKRLLILVLFSFSIALASCSDEGPMENAGEKMDKAVEETGDKLEDAGDKIQDAVEETGDKLEDAGDKMQEAVDK